jgi:hypothetical protein
MKKTFDSVITNIVSTENELKRCAAWASSISINELDGAIFSGIKLQRNIGKSEQECAKYVYRNFKNELSEIISFNRDMGVDF